MVECNIFRITCLLLVLTAGITLQPVQAKDGFLGPDACRDCHDIEYDIWLESQHGVSLDEMPKRALAKRVVEAVGGASNPRENAVCQQCHFTVAPEPGQTVDTAVAGPSCEHCHGPAADWRDIHRDYGGRRVTKRTEPKAHRQERIDSSVAAGMRWPFMRYEITRACYECHAIHKPGLNSADRDGLTKGKHPIKPEFEIVAYSQGTVRHRFYPPDFDVNQELTQKQLAELWVIGQAAQLVVATEAATASDNARYQATQRARAREAREALTLLKSIGAVAQLLETPTDATARAATEALADHDVLGVVGPRLPDPDLYE